MTPRTTPSRTPRSPTALVAAGSVGLVLALAGCSSSGEATPDASQPETEQGDAPQGAPQAGVRAPGVSGEVAAVNGTTAQVQDSESQTAVSWSDDTTITVAVDGTLADVIVGSCIVAIVGVLPGEEAEGSAESSTATSAVVSQPVDGECTAGFGGAFPGGGFPGEGEPPGGSPTDLPSDMPGRPEDAPSDMPSGAPGGEGGPPGGVGVFGGVTTGSVTAVDRSAITVSTSSPEGESAAESVTVDNATTYTVQRAGANADVVVGQCVSALGETDDSGALTATSLSLSTPGDEGCTSGFPGGRGGFPGGAGGRQGGGGDA